uniref:Putative reverse transcriptase, RNA-dependent DNA polymerase n=1 Tax=Tanacetum cinerariifolium TaxID=118510 RepID=A0A6L2KUR0_TANCI|nr:putative reverse transcriptase, RNA-dependent DNA polymerase [Tanacetum cinerariifolium]
MIVEDTLNIRFLENEPNVKGNGPDWLFDIDSLTISMNYEPFVAGKQTNGIVGTKDNIVAGQAEKKKEPEQEYILIPICTTNLLISQGPKDSAVDTGKKATEVDESQVLDNGGQDDQVTRNYHLQILLHHHTLMLLELLLVLMHLRNILLNDFSPFKNAFSIPHVPIVTPINDTRIFGNAYDDEAMKKEVDMNNLDSSYTIPDAPLTKFLKDHPKDQVIGSIETPVQTRQMTKINEEHDPSWVEAMQDELLQFKLLKVWTLVDLPKDKWEIGTKWVFRNKKDERGIMWKIGTKWVFRNKKDERGIMVKNKARLVALGHTQEECIDYDEVFAPVARIKAIRLYLAYASFKDFIVYQIDVKSAFLFGKIEDEVYVCQPPGFEDPNFPNKVYKVEKALYGLHQVPRAWPDITFVVYACARFQVTPKTSHLHAMKRIFRYLKGQPKLGLWYPRDSPFDLEAYSNSDYAGASLDRKSTTGGCQILGKRLISWHCKKQTIVANFTTEAEYVAASCCGQVIWIQNQMLDYGFNLMNTKTYIDNESTIYIVKNPVFYSKTKHIEIRHHFIRDSYEKKLIQVIKIHTDHNVADLLTKAFDVGRFNFLNDGIQVSVVGLTYYWLSKAVWMDLAYTYCCQMKVHAARHNLMLLVLGTTCLPNDAIFEGLARMGAKTTVWNEFNSTMASAIICLANNQKLNFSKYIVENMVKNLEAGVKFYMFPRFVQVFVNHQLGDMSHHKEIFSTSLSLRRHTILTQPSSSQPQRKHKPRRKQREATEVPHTKPQAEERVPTPSHDLLPSGEDRLQLNELMDICTKLSDMVLSLEQTKTNQATEIEKLKKRVKKLEGKKKKTTHGLKRLYKVGLSARVESSEDEDGLGAQKDTSKQGRIAEIDANEDIF